MSALIYGDGSEQVTLPYCNITRFAQRARYDDSNTDWFCTEFDIQATCVLNWNYLSLVAPDLLAAGEPVTTNPADIMAAIRSRLLKPRQRLSVTFAGVELIPQATGGAGTVDAQNGPRPQYCEILDLTNETFIINYGIQATYWENNRINQTGTIVQNRTGNDVLYNRWSESAEISGTEFTTRTREGKFIIRSDNADGWIADQLRTQMAAVAVPDGFLRESSHYTVDESGLGIAYRIVDREVFQKPPAPAYRAAGEFTEHTNRLGAMRYMESRVTLEGSKTTPMDALVRTAVLVAYAKIGGRGRQMDANGITAVDANGKRAPIVLDNAYVRTNLYENVVEAYIRVGVAATDERMGPIAAFVGMQTATPLSNPAYTPDYHVRGTGNILLQAAAYYDPSLRTAQLSTGKSTADSNPLIGKAVQLPGLQPGQAGKKEE